MAMTSIARNSDAPHLTLRDVERYIKTPPEHSVLVCVTPEVARELLVRYNVENRGLKPHKIRPLIGSIRGGGWLVTGETIKFSPQRLLDGQNRLTACAESGIAITTHVVFGIPDEAFAVIDTGAPRTAPDVLVCAGIENPSIISHAVLRLHAWDEAPGQRSVLRLSPNQVLHYYQTRYSTLPAHVAWGRQLQAATGLPASRGTTLHYAFERAAGTEAADAFMAAWIENDPSVPQAALLRRRINQLTTMQVGVLSANIIYAMAIKAFNAYSRGQSLDVAGITWRADEPLPVLAARGA